MLIRLRRLDFGCALKLAAPRKIFENGAYMLGKGLRSRI